MRWSPMRSPDPPQDGGGDARGSGQVQIVSRRAVTIGLALSAALIVGMVLWRLAAKVETVKELAEFDFSVEEPQKEEFELKEPVRDLRAASDVAVESGEKMEDAMLLVRVDDQPDVQMMVVPSEAHVVEEVVQVRSIEVRRPQIDLDVREVDVDAPEQVGEAPEAIEFTMDAAIADASGPADLFRYESPNPADRWRPFTWIRASKPSRSPKSVLRTFSEQEPIAMAELGPMSIKLSGDGDSIRALTRVGGPNAHSAVNSALQWLAAHQEPDGHWAPEKHKGKGSTVGNSGLSLLALMAGGHTPRRGEYRRQVTKGLEWLLKQQKVDGQVGDTMYEHAIAAMALSEACGRAQDERMGEAARRSLAWIERCRLADGGWRYQPSSQLSDVSVTAWVIQALKAAKLAQVKFDTRLHAQALQFLDTLTDKGAGPDTSGAAGYTYEASQNYPHRAYPAMTCAAMLIRQYSGVGAKSDILAKGAALTRTLPPDWDRKNFYLWYYATYAMYNMGGENRIWWNRRIRDVLEENQRRDGDAAGSWDPKDDPWAEQGGRIYTTALGALCLEARYRYADALNGFGVAPGADDLFAQ